MVEEAVKKGSAADESGGFGSTFTVGAETERIARFLVSGGLRRHASPLISKLFVRATGR